jgi:hypothetical protein
MYKIYRTPKDTIIAQEVENTDFTVKLLTDLDCKEYVMIKWQDAVNIYNFSLVGQVNEIADEISLEEFREITYAKKYKESLEQEIKPNSMNSLKFDWRNFAETGITGS